MTPYELRFEIFKQAYSCATDEFHASFANAEMLRNDGKSINFPDFPTYEYIETLANKINNFVSSK